MWSYSFISWRVLHQNNFLILTLKKLIGVYSDNLCALFKNGFFSDLGYG